MPLPELRPISRSDTGRVRRLLGRRAPRSGRVERARLLLHRYDDHQALAALEEREKERYDRWLRRQPQGASGWRRGQPQCGGCRRILAGRGRTCPNCGYTDGAGYPR
jgi:hypothetical protein